MTYKLVGQEPYQIPSNADLGTLAYQNADGVSIGQINVGNTATVAGLISPLTVGYSQSAAGTLLYLSQVPANLSTGGLISGSNIAANTTVTSFVSGFSTYQPTYTATTASTLIALTSTYGLSTSFGVGGTGVTYGTVVSSISNTGLPVTYGATSSTTGLAVIYIGTTTNVAVNQVVLGTGISTGTYVTSITANTFVTLNQTSTVATNALVTFVPTVTLSSAITANTLTQNLLFFPTVTLNQNSSAAVTQGTVVNNYIAPTGAGNAAFVVQQGGIGVTGNSYFANNLAISGTAQPTSSLTGALQVAGGAGISGGLWVGGIVTATNFILNGYQVSTSTSGVASANSATSVSIQSTLTNASFYPVFVSANTSTLTALPEYTTSTFQVNPGTGLVTVQNLQVNGYNYVSGTNKPSLIMNQPTGGGFYGAIGNYTVGQTDTNTFGLGWTGQTTGWNSTMSLLWNEIGVVSLPTNIAAFSTNSGALQVVGGVGVGGGGYFGGVVTATNFILNGYQVTTSTTVNIGNVLVQSTTSNAAFYPVFVSTSTTSTTALPEYTTNSFSINPSTGAVNITSTTSATSTTTGALTVTGGVGIGGALYAGNIYSNGTQLIPSVITEFTATPGQALFTIPGGYTVGTVQVFANGVQLGSADYTASNGTTITLGIGRNSGDIIRVVAGITSTLAPADPIVVNDISNYFNNLSSVFTLQQDQSLINSIVDSKDLEVVIDGQRLAPYVDEYRYPWITPYDSYKGFRVRGAYLTIYNAPAVGSSAVVIVRASSIARQKRKYPYSAATIAFGD